MPSNLKRVLPIGMGLMLAVLAGGCASPHEKGFATREMEGVEGVEVISTRLQIDLRPLAERKPATIEVTYRLRNPEAEKDIDFFIVCPTANGVAARLNGNALPIENRSTNGEKGWPKNVSSVDNPTSTPRPNDHNPLPYECIKNDSGALIHARLPNGDSELHISYSSSVTAYMTVDPTRIWQYVHQFSPSSKWKKFGPLDLSVDVPEGWEAVDNWGMTRVGDRLEKTFQDRPTEPLMLALRFVPDAEKRQMYQTANLVLLVILIVATILIARSNGRSWAEWDLGHSNRRPNEGNLVIVCLIWAAGALGAAWWTVKGSMHFLVPPSQRSRDFESAGEWSLCCSGPPAVIGAVIFGWVLFAVVRSMVMSSIVRATPQEDWHHDDRYDDDWDRR